MIITTLAALALASTSPRGSTRITEDLVDLRPRVDGIVSVPVAKAGKIDSLWKTDADAFSAEPMEAGRVPGLSVPQDDAKTLVVVSDKEKQGVPSSKRFLISTDMKAIQIRVIGQGSMSTAYAALVVSVDGQKPFVWTQQAPSSSTSFEKMSWNVSKLVEQAGGKPVIGETQIVDKSPMTVIGIANCASESPPVELKSLVSTVATPRSEMSIERYGIVAKYLPFSRISTSEDLLSRGLELQVGVEGKTLDFLIQEVYRKVIMPDMDLWTGAKIDQIAQKILSKIETMLSKFKLPKNRLLKEWLLAEGVSGWVSTHIAPAYDIPEASANANERIRRGQAQVVLDQQPPSANCSGMSRLTRDLARAVGLKCTHVGGFLRQPGEAPPPSENHGWVVFNLQDDKGNELPIPSDTSLGNTLAWARQMNGKIYEDFLLPRSAIALELFHATHYAYYITDGWADVHESSDVSLTKMPIGSWRAIDTSYLKPVREKFVKDEIRFVQR